MIPRRSVVIASLLTLVLTGAFIVASQGMSLIGTFVPGMCFSYIAFLIIARPGLTCDSWEAIAPIFFATLAFQFLHFAEEYATGFPELFPVAFGGQPYSRTAFVAFNMTAYAVFAISAIAVFHFKIYPLLIPVLFFTLYGAWGNAVSHTCWCIQCGGYFPGGLTAIGYFILGPILVFRFIPNRRIAILLLFLFALTLVGTSAFLFDPTIPMGNLEAK